MEERAQWGSRIGFVLAAAGSAVGLGNIWKFPYITGENGGGAFVLIYLVCIALVGLPIMTAEITLGRMAQSSPVGAFRALSKPRSPWIGVGWLGVIAAFVILSYYSVVAGWSLHYIFLSLRGGFSGQTPEGIKSTFGALYASPGTNLFWHAVFMGATIAIVLGGVQKGVERASRVMMPALFFFLLALVLYAGTLPGFGDAFRFVLGMHTEKLTPKGVLEAVGHSFFTLSVGMGAMLTYGSYLGRDDDVVNSAIWIAALDTLIALAACLILFPITFSQGMKAAAGPGLVFINMPIALAKVPGGALLALVFFVLLAFAALTSAISLLEVAAAYFIDERGWPRSRAALVTGLAIFLLGVPSALSGGTHVFGDGFAKVTGKNWFDTFDYLASNWMLPLGGLGIALFLSYRVGEKARAEAISRGSKLGSIRGFYLAWLQLLRYVVPTAIVVIMLHAVGVL